MPSECRDPELMAAEIEAMRIKIAALETRVEELDRLAHDDPLVRAVNRRGMVRELERMIASRQRHGTPAAMLFVDLDDLKILNDSFGHQGGDAALIHVAEQLHRGAVGCNVDTYSPMPVSRQEWLNRLLRGFGVSWLRWHQ